MARPRKHPEEQRSERLPGIRLTPAERHHVEDMAARAGVPVGEFCRRSILGQRLPKARAEDAATVERQAVAELNRVGVNLNQIAARVNFTGELAHDFRAALAEVRAAVIRLMGGAA